MSLLVRRTIPAFPGSPLHFGRVRVMAAPRPTGINDQRAIGLLRQFQ